VREKRDGDVTLLRNVHTGEILEQYLEVYHSEKEQKEDQAVFQRRMKNYSNFELNVVKVIEHEAAVSHNLCTSINSEHVYTERIVKRLSEFGVLGEEALVYLAHDTLNGFGHIFKL
jgi:adenine C2-methylase RlmN of 23S rRNA A2503 and tRNA A37